MLIYGADVARPKKGHTLSHGNVISTWMAYMLGMKPINTAYGSKYGQIWAFCWFGLHRRLIRKLAQPNITFIVEVLSAFMQFPDRPYWSVAS